MKRHRILSWTMLNILAGAALSVVAFEAYMGGSAAAQPIDDSVPYRVCVRDVHGLLPDLSLAVASVERAFAEAQADPDWGGNQRQLLPVNASAMCQDEPSIYAEGTVVHRWENFVETWPADNVVEARGPFDMIIFVLSDDEIEHFFWNDHGTRLVPRRRMTQEQVCQVHGTPPQLHAVCAETTGGLYTRPSEIMDPHVLANGLLALWHKSR